MQVVAAFDMLNMRLLGIALASLSSGLGELTFLQLSTTYPGTGTGEAVGYFASGTGAAGLLGAALWWFLRSLGVREGVGISSVSLVRIAATRIHLSCPFFWLDITHGHSLDICIPPARDLGFYRLRFIYTV